MWKVPPVLASPRLLISVGAVALVAGGLLLTEARQQRSDLLRQFGSKASLGEVEAGLRSSLWIERGKIAANERTIKALESTMPPSSPEYEAAMKEWAHRGKLDEAKGAWAAAVLERDSLESELAPIQSWQATKRTGYALLVLGAALVAWIASARLGFPIARRVAASH